MALFFCKNIGQIVETEGNPGRVSQEKHVIFVRHKDSARDPHSEYLLN